MNDIYKAPDSVVEEQGDNAVMAQLNRQQSYLLGMAISFICTFGLLIYFASYVGQIPMFAFLCPGFLSGFAVKILARPYSMPARVLPSLICGGLTILYFVGTGLDLYAVLIAFLNTLVCLALSRRLLSYEQEAALYKLRNKI